MADKLTKLSQAIRLGSTFRPQSRGAYFRRSTMGGRSESCALGAAYEALTGRSDMADIARLEVKDPMEFLHERFGIHNCGLSPLYEAARMNDAGSTREQVADWLEGRGL